MSERPPTPLEQAPRLARALGLGALWIKREDLAGYGLGGNKIRKIDLILADAVRAGADTLITTAAAQSNFCRALSAGAARAGLATLLLLRSEGEAPVAGNLLLDHLFGARVRFIPVVDPWSDAVVRMLEDAAAEVRAAGGVPYIVHLPGRTAGLAASAWVAAARELDRQWQAAGIDPAVIVLAAGSGLTAAGLALGLREVGRRCRVVAVSVQQKAARLAPWIVHAAAEAGRHCGIAAALREADFDVTDDQIGPAYGMPTPEGLAAMTLAARSEGLVLDPVYTGKALAGLAALARAGRFGGSDTVVFLHSGGVPTLFAQSEAVARHLTGGPA